uniref:C3H1-type domain-containing protein n=2 Tax=Rhodosorus marinus TaxID=101924 RepID=A0A7S2ZB76_9RHOD|mmetsp:Transcript_10827/g.45094  ORF Transcript_10827/g.45094 Transcript_10827/m.45094 type:complete len:318 (+) Transcript_10827:87-1040(+)
MNFNMDYWDYSTFSGGVPLAPNSGFESTPKASGGLGNGSFGRGAVEGATGPAIAESQVKEQAYAVWEEQQIGKTSRIPFERTPVGESAMYKDFPRRKQRERSPSNVQDLYKTELCNSFTENGSCPYGANCQFAHGGEELRAVTRHPKYKTKLCRNFAERGSCPYGSRCRFIHGDEDDTMLEHDSDSFPLQGQAGPAGQLPPQRNSLYFRAPSPDANLPPAFPAMGPPPSVAPLKRPVVQDDVFLFNNGLLNAGSASAPTSRQASPTPNQMTGETPVRASTPTPQGSSSIAELSDASDAKVDANAPKRRLAVFAKFAN